VLFHDLLNIESPEADLIVHADKMCVPRLDPGPQTLNRSAHHAAASTFLGGTRRLGWARAAWFLGGVSDGVHAACAWEPVRGLAVVNRGSVQ